MKLTNTHPSTN